MIFLDAEEAGQALGRAPLAAGVPRVGTDSRSIAPGDLFIALRGERFDGHDYVAAAFARGASGAVVERRVWEARREAADEAAAGSRAETSGQTGGGSIYQVDDSLAALWALATATRRKSGARVFAITGSAGKTSTKDLLCAMLRRVRRVVATAANQNNEIGVPLTLLEIEPDTEAVVVEMGMRGLGQISALARVAEPDVAVVTNIHPVHLELLGSLGNIAKAKAELFQALSNDGVVVVPYDCADLQPYLDRLEQRIVRFGIGETAAGADVKGRIERGGDPSRYVLTIEWPEGEARIETCYVPQHGVENVVAAAAACYAAGLPVGECAEGMKDVQLSGGRGDVVLVPGLCVIDDTYNANPAAVRAALDNLVHVAAEQGGRAVAVLGDMLELGPESETYHREVGAYAAEVGVTALWGVGPLAKAIVDGFVGGAAAIDGKRSDWAAGHVGSSEETSSVVSGLCPGDVVLFKASRGMRLEAMVDRVVAAAERGAWSCTPDDPDSGLGGSKESERC